MQIEYTGIILRENIKQNNGRKFTSEELKINNNKQVPVSVNFNANQIVGVATISYKKNIGLEAVITITDEKLFNNVFGESLYPTSYGKIDTKKDYKEFILIEIGLCINKNVDSEIKQLEKWDHKNKKTGYEHYSSSIDDERKFSLNIFLDTTTFDSPEWMCFESFYMYSHPTFNGLLQIIRDEWRHDRHMVG